MKYKVTVYPQQHQDWHNMVDWCFNNVGLVEYSWKIEDFNPFTFGFKKEGDAVVFALKWL